MAPRVLAALPVLVAVVGVALAVAPDPVAVFEIGLALIGAGLVVAALNFAIGDPRRLVMRLPAATPRARALDEVTNLLEELCIGHGLPLPRLFVVPHPSANAMALGWSEREATLVVTSGLLERLDRIELEGVIAHELAHLKRGDVRDAAFATVACGALSLVAPRAPGLVRRLLDPSREASADLGAAFMTRFPPGLIKALQKLGSSSEVSIAAKTSVGRLTDTLWLVPRALAGTPRVGELDVTERVGLLAEL